MPRTLGEHAVLAQAGGRLGIPALRLDYLGRWRAKGSEQYWADARHEVLDIQRTVAMALRSGCEKAWNEELALKRFQTRMASHMDAAALQAQLEVLGRGPELFGGEAVVVAAMTTEDETPPSDEDRSASEDEAKVEAHWASVSDKGLKTLHITGLTRCRYSASGLFTKEWHYVADADALDGWNKCGRCFVENETSKWKQEKKADASTSDSSTESRGSASDASE